MSSDMTQALAQAHHLDVELTLSVGQYSIAGRKTENEDAIGIRIPEGNLLTTKGAAAVIADGVSAAEAGQEASQTAVTNFLTDYFSTPESWTVKKSAAEVLSALNRWLYSRGRSFTDNTKGYVTTFSALVVKSQQAHLFHAGDSRIYLWRNGELKQITTDHAIPVSEDHSYLARALGLDVGVEVDYQVINLEQGDCFLLSTDGIHDTLTDKQIAALLSDPARELEQSCEALADAAFESGSSDNLSCQLVRIDSLPMAAMDDVVNRLTELGFPPFLEPGMILDGYRIERELHASARSQVFLVEDVSSGGRYCMKTPSVNYEDDPAYIERFVMESWIGSRINSPYVVKVIDHGRRRSCLYYLTEYVRGITLTQWMREHPRPPVEEAVYLIEQIGMGLRAFHRRETLHQDIRPDNVLIDSEGRVKIVDFDACRVAGITEISSPLARQTALGTATYSAPEYRVGTVASYSADQFSLAIISYEMLTGQAPFGGKLESCHSQADFLSTKYTESFKLNPLVPHWIDGALRKGLRFHPGRRHADVAEFVHELKHPNPLYLEYHRRPLMERDPLRAWKILSGVLAITQVLTLILLLH